MSEPPAWCSSEVLLASLSTLGVGGRARWFARACTVEEVARACRWSNERSLPLFVLGGGSNLVVADTGFDGLVLQVAIPGIDLRPSGGETLVTAGAGEPWDTVVAETVAHGLRGIELLSGIPGTTGGTPIQNVGAYGQEISRVVERVRVFDRHDGVERGLRSEECRFAYRTSRFKGADAGRFVVCGVTLRLAPGPPEVGYAEVAEELRRTGRQAPSVSDARLAVLAVRRRKGMVVDPADPDTRSVGSFFMNPVVDESVRERIASRAGASPPAHDAGAGRVRVPAAWLIERSGFGKGVGEGSVGLSSKHPLAIVNRGGATARDVVRFARRVKAAVGERFGIWLRPEPVFVGWGDDPDVQFLVRNEA